MKKKILAGVLMLSLSFSMTGCGFFGLASMLGKEEINVVEEDLPEKTPRVELPEEEAQHTISETDAFGKGSWEDDIYTNTFAGLRLKVPEGWVRTSAEDLEAESDEQTITDLEISNADDAAIVMLQDIALAQLVMNDNITEEYIEFFVNYITNDLEQLTLASKDESVTICGNEYRVVEFHMDMFGQTMKLIYMIRIKGDYAITVMGVTSDKTAADFAAMFS